LPVRSSRYLLDNTIFIAAIKRRSTKSTELIYNLLNSPAELFANELLMMVLPKEIREKAKIRSGDKLAVVSLEKDGKICCLSLIKVEDLEVMVKSMLGPVMDDVFKR
jgi:hypothetical protein